MVDGYRQALDEVRATDEHMIYLRAHLEHASSMRKDEDDIEDSLTILANEGAKLCTFLEDRPALMTDDDAYEAIRHIASFANCLADVKREVDTFRRSTRQLEIRHERLIRLTRLRKMSAVKHAAMHRVAAFTRTMREVLHALEPHLDAANSLRLRTEVHRQFATIPTRALTSNALTPIPADPPTESSAMATTVIDALADRFKAFGDEPDMPLDDLAHLKAYVRAMTTLFGIAELAAGALETVRERFQQYLRGFGSRDGKVLSAREVLESYKLGPHLKRLDRNLEELLTSLNRFDEELEARHVRIIGLAAVIDDIELATAAVGHVDLQRHLLMRLHAVLHEVLEPEHYAIVKDHVLERPRGSDAWSRLAPIAGEESGLRHEPVTLRSREDPDASNA